jgi:hypothetical protein
MKVTGIALESHAETVGASAEEKTWPAEEIKKSADTLTGRPVWSESGNSSSSPKVQDVIGKVISSYYEEEIGLVYEAEIYDEEFAEKLKKNEAELAPRMYHDRREEEGKIITKDIEFRSLFVCPKSGDGVPGAIKKDGVLQP